MIDDHVKNPKSIKYYVNAYLQNIKSSLIDKTVIDIPAGNGVTTEILSNLGAKVEPFDLFPEYFALKNVKCKRANIVDKIPVENDYADMLVSQEGIEHFSDQIKVFKEFNRVLKKQGKLLITTPSYSNLAARFNYLLFEREETKSMAPNEIDDIWMSEKTITNEIYYGHIFLIGLQKLRIIGKLTGFKINEIRYVRLSKGSLFLFPFFYPLILFFSLKAYYRHMKKDKGLSKEKKRGVYKEQLFININPKNLINKHIFIIFEKECNLADIDFRNESIIRHFHTTT